jgi:hypothetical protein
MIMDCSKLLVIRLEKMSDNFYKSNHGYYLNENKKWTFVPFEKQLDKEQLLEIIKILECLNETLS